MRRPRQRRLKRSRRKHSKDVYDLSASKIQRGFRTYLDCRYEKVCTNYKDDECIMLQPVSRIPRVLLIVLDGFGFDARHLLTWMNRSNSHPLSRCPLSKTTKKKCVEKIVRYLEDVQNRSGPKGYFGRKKILERMSSTKL